MTAETAKRILDICQEARQLEHFLPSLPDNITPRCVRVIEQIAVLSEKGPVRVSDISEMLDVTKPGITLVLRDLNKMGYVEKQKDTTDNRVVYVSLTKTGRELYQTYVADYHAHLGTILNEIGEDQVSLLEKTIHRILELVAADTNNVNK